MHKLTQMLISRLGLPMACVVVLAQTATAAENTALWEKALLDDFSTASEVASIGTKWKLSPASENNGKSSMALDFVQGSLTATGTVRLGNMLQGPGRVSVKLPLDSSGKEYDLREWIGIRITYKRSGAPVLLRVTCGEIRNGDHFAADLPATAEVITLDLPWNQLGQVMSRQQPWQGNRASGIELIAYAWRKQDFSLYVERLELYK
jgi:hypothetical protein